MIPASWRRLLPALCLATALPVAADPPAAPPSTGAGDPATAQAPVPPVVHRSAFDGYRRHADAAPAPWQRANETVGRIGGWRTYAREAQPAAPPASAPAGRGHAH
ncbi:hypothetical protein [uncultured Methylibium sp.]|uniref:hypothetical protein n=1 Tax=uncultured Methylibium sp. TaxID=381093 RepID=UPI0025DBD2D8|nr:hypothetical protein [uncultured Methylibium sp.]